MYVFNTLKIAYILSLNEACQTEEVVSRIEALSALLKSQTSHSTGNNFSVAGN